MHPRHVAELVLIAVLWGTAYLFTRAAVPEFGAIPMIAMRMSIAAVVLVPVLALRGGLQSLRTHLMPMIVVGVFFTSMPFVLIAHAAHSLSAGHLAILNATAPLFAAIVGWLWVREKLGAARAAGLALGFAGVVFLVWGEFSIASAAGVAVAIMLGVSLLWAFAAHFTRRHLTGVDSLAITAGSMLICALVLLPFSLPTWPAEPPSARAWAEVVFLGLGSSGIGMLLYFRLLREIGAVPTMSVTFLNPVVAMTAGIFYLGEPVTLQMLGGSAIILAGTALTLGLVGRRRAPSA